MKTRTERRPEALPVRAQMKTRTEHRSEALPVRAPFPAKPLSSVSRREPRAGNYGKGGPSAGWGLIWFALHSPQSLYLRFPGANPGPGITEERPGLWPEAQPVRAPSPAKPLTSVSGREPRAGNYGKGGPSAGWGLIWFALHSPQSLYLRFPGANPGPGITEERPGLWPEAQPVRAPSPAKPLTSVSGREPQAGNYGIAARPPAGGSAGSRSIPSKAFFFGFRARTPGRELRNRRSECRLGDQPVRAPMEKYSTKVSRRPPCCTFHYYNPERNTLSCGFMDNRRRTMDKRVDKHSCPHAYPQPCREAGYPQAPQLL